MKYLAILALILTACAPRPRLATQSDLDALRNRTSEAHWETLVYISDVDARVKRLEPVYRVDTVLAPPECGNELFCFTVDKECVARRNAPTDRRCYRIDSVRVWP